MSHTKNNSNEAAMLHKFGKFSRNMIDNHHLENLSEFVLHDVCSDDEFGIEKAAYLVHNPDFNCVKGVAGFHRQESFNSSSWNDHKAFTSHMKQADFNQLVRAYSQENFNHKEISDQHIEQFAEALQIVDPAYHTWNAKHNNQGLFIFDGSANSQALKSHLQHFLHMLSFCPIF